jgi:hypothetical protein
MRFHSLTTDYTDITDEKDNIKVGWLGVAHITLSC